MQRAKRVIPFERAQPVLCGWESARAIIDATLTLARSPPLLIDVLHREHVTIAL